MARVIIDVREPAEFVTGHIEGALNLPSTKLDATTPELATISKDDEVIVYCRSGGRASSAVNMLSDLGYTNVTNGINQATVIDKYM
jgi:phage shock protein E